MQEENAEIAKVEQSWRQIVDRKVEEAESKGLPLRFVDVLRNSNVGNYITIDRRISPYTILFFHANLDLDNGKGTHSAVVLEQGQSPSLMLSIQPKGADASWVIAPDSSSTFPVLQQNFSSLKRSKLFDPKIGVWKGQYPNVDKIIEALRK